jgi:hypothetical protein
VAKIVTGSLVGEIRNKLGDEVFSRNTYGTYTRQHVIPDQTATDWRTWAQTAWATVSERWNNALSDQQRNAWQQWATCALQSRSPVRRNVLSGRQAFIRINHRLALYGAAFLNDPPGQQQVDQLEPPAVAAGSATQTLILSFSPSPLPANHALMIEATPNLNPGRSFAADEFGWILYLDPTDTSPADISAAWLARKWPTGVTGVQATQTIIAGKKIFVRCRLINTENGAYSINQVAAALAT